MRDLVFVAFLMALFATGFRRPFLFVLAYAYVDIIAPQRLTYWLLNSVPVSMIAAALAMLSWAIVDDKRNARVAPRQGLMLLLLFYCWMTTIGAQFPVEAAFKWEWVWKALAFAIFLPLTLTTRLRIEGLALYMVLCAASIIIVGGIKTLASGGGYGVLNLMVSNNAGLYESSTISAIAIAIIPLILHLMKFGTVFPPDWRVKLFGVALIFACLLIPVGTEARTGLVCIGVLAVLLLRDARRRILYLGLMAAAGMIAIPFLPQSFTQRMGTIGEYQADSSASSRVAVWKWTWDYAKDHPLGGGFDAFRGNNLRIEKVETETVGAVRDVTKTIEYDQARAYHSAYFEMLGEQGYPGLLIWLSIQLGGLWRMEILRRRYRGAGPDQHWIASLATALQNGQVIYLVGAAFIAIAIQPFALMMIALQIGLDTYAGRRTKAQAFQPMGGPRTRAAPTAA